MSVPRRVSYWIVPRAEDAARYFQVINRLARANNAPVFAPHLSLASIEGEQPDLSPCLEILEGLELQPLEISMTDVFTMSLFVRVERHPALLAARDFMQSQPGAISSRAFDPHLSLCYGPPPKGAEAWQDIRALLNQPIRFHSLHAVAIPPQVETQDDVRSWNDLESYPI
ncbi:MAG: hypothetical protein AAGL99_18235 [Pseudomonadota bacterium]